MFRERAAALAAVHAAEWAAARVRVDRSLPGERLAPGATPALTERPAQTESSALAGNLVPGERAGQAQTRERQEAWAAWKVRAVPGETPVQAGIPVLREILEAGGTLMPVPAGSPATVPGERPGRGRWAASEARPARVARVARVVPAVRVGSPGAALIRRENQPNQVPQLPLVPQKFRASGGAGARVAAARQGQPAEKSADQPTEDPTDQTRDRPTGRAAWEGDSPCSAPDSLGFRNTRFLSAAAVLLLSLFWEPPKRKFLLHLTVRFMHE